MGRKETTEENSARPRPVERYGLRGLIGLLALVALGLLTWWILSVPESRADARLPGADGRPDLAQAVANVVIGEYFQRLAPTPPSRTGEWPQFRGPNRDGVSTEPVPLIRSFGDGPDILWQVALGEGHAGAAVHAGLVYVLDYDEELESDMLRCFVLTTGQEVWRRWYEVETKRNHGISRTVPAVSDTCVVTMGPQCHVMAVEPRSGDLLWTHDLVREFGIEVPLWYTGQCPLIDGDTAVIAVGGNTLMLGIDCATGETVWETPNPAGLTMSHSSVVPMVILGTRMYVYSAIGGIVGVSAEPENAGELLWISSDFGAQVIAPSPIPVADNRVFSCAGYGAGSIMLELSSDDDTFSVTTVFRKNPRQGLTLEQQSPLVYQNLIIGIMPKDAGTLRDQFVAYDSRGEFVWSSGETLRYGLGPFVVADGIAIILDDTGDLTLAEVSESGMTVLDETRILPGVDSWAPLAITGGVLLARDSTTMVCVDLRQDG